MIESMAGSCVSLDAVHKFAWSCLFGQALSDGVGIFRSSPKTKTQCPIQLVFKSCNFFASAPEDATVGAHRGSSIEMVNTQGGQEVVGSMQAPFTF